MTIRVSPRLRAGTFTLATGLLLAVVPGVALPEAAHAAPPPTSLGLAVNHSSSVAGAPVELLAHLNVAGKPIAFYQAYRGQAARVIFRGTTDANGNLLIKGAATYSSSYFAAFAGDEAYAASQSRTVTTTVQVKMLIKSSGGAKRKGYRLYRQSKKATVAAAVGPAKTGARVTFRLQIRRSGSWRTVDTRRYTLRKGSAVAVTYRGKAGKRYRVRAEYAGDTLNAGNHSAWTYSRFRR